jgi:hypothetical protein
MRSFQAELNPKVRKKMITSKAELTLFHCSSTQFATETDEWKEPLKKIPWNDWPAKSCTSNGISNDQSSSYNKAGNVRTKASH